MTKLLIVITLILVAVGAIFALLLLLIHFGGKAVDAGNPEWNNFK
jgi:hypothetical protein